MTIESIEVHSGEPEQQVYNFYLDGNNTYFADGLLAHNRGGDSCFVAGTKVIMADGTHKNIEDVEIGSPKTGKMPKAKAKAKTKAKKEEPATAGVGDKSVEAAERYLEYDPVSKVTWKLGDATPYLYLANIFESIAETTKRLEIAELLTNAFRTILASKPTDLLAAVYLASNTIHPQHEGIDLGIGDATLIKALAEATGRKDESIKNDYKEAGDLGSVAMASRSTQRMMFPPPPLTVTLLLPVRWMRLAVAVILTFARAWMLVCSASMSMSLAALTSLMPLL